MKAQEMLSFWGASLHAGSIQKNEPKMAGAEWKQQHSLFQTIWPTFFLSWMKDIETVLLNHRVSSKAK